MCSNPVTYQSGRWVLSSFNHSRSLQFRQVDALNNRKLVGWLLLEFYILVTFKVIPGQVPTCDSVYSAASLGCWHHGLISHAVTLFWHWANQSWPYPINAKRQTRKLQVSNLYVIGLTRLETKLIGVNPQEWKQQSKIVKTIVFTGRM